MYVSGSTFVVILLFYGLQERVCIRIIYFLAAFADVRIFVFFYRYWEGADVCTMLEDIDFMCEVLRILMEACTDNG